METNRIIISEYCRQSAIEPTFITLLEENELIHIQKIDNERFLPLDELNDLEKYARWYYDLSINIEGIDAIRHLTDRIRVLQDEMKSLRVQIEFLSTRNPDV
jgi:hypothetical protein